MKPRTWIFVIPLLLLSCRLFSAPAIPPTSAYAVTPGATHVMPTAFSTESTLPPRLPVSLITGAGFRDYLAVADQFYLTLNGVPAPPTGQIYQGWLLADDGAFLSVGTLPLSPEGQIGFVWNSPSGENLLTRYTRFQITLEPGTGSANSTGKALFAGRLDGAALANARRLFVKNAGQPATPLDTAFATGLLAQTDIASQHVQNAINAAAIGAQVEMQAHLEHVINILDGLGGARYGDHDGSGTAENPGDGFGVIGYSGQVAGLLTGQAASEMDAGIQAQSAVIQEHCLEVVKLQDLEVAKTQLGEIKRLMEQLQTGLVAELYRAAQDAVHFEVLPVE